MGKNRDGLSIVVAILTAANRGCSKTHIMRQANLSFNLLEKYLMIVIESGLITLNSRKCHLTESGRDFLRQYRQFEDKYSKANQTMEFLMTERERLARIFTKTNHVGNSNGIGR